MFRAQQELAGGSASRRCLNFRARVAELTAQEFVCEVFSGAGEASAEQYACCYVVFSQQMVVMRRRRPMLPPKPAKDPVTRGRPAFLAECPLLTGPPERSR